MGKGIILVLGGTKTGKTSFAQSRALKIESSENLPVTYIATAEVIDKEMEERIENHKKSRPENWITIEEPINVSRRIKDLSGTSSVILLDCLTLLMTNILFKAGENCSKDKAIEIVFNEIDSIIDESKNLSSELIIISNQVENGLVSESKWTRMFQDIAGMVHQKLATVAKEVYMMNAGLPLKLK